MRISITLGLTLGVILSVAVGAQDKKTTDVSIQGHVYEPAKLEPSDERVKGLRVPTGFHVQKFAELQNPRMLAVGPDGSIYVSQREPGTVALLKDTDGDGVADVQRVVAEKPMLHGLAVHEGKLYLAAVKEIYVADIKSDGTLGPLQTLIKDLPDGGQHPNRTLGVSPDRMLYITSGSTCNECRETNPESATVLRATLDGRARKVFASGLRNTIGFGWHPVSKKLYGMDHGIDWLGDEDQREELNEIVDGAKYGWPYVYADSKLNPHNEPPKSVGLTNEDWAKQSKEPVLLYTAHSAPMQLAFYTGSMFPAEYRNDAFVAMRGSWNRKPPSGYEVVRVRFDQSGKPTAIEPFLTGFLVPNGAPDGKDGQFARLTGVAVARDGSLLICDDTNNTLYRVSYGAQPRGSMSGRQSITSMLPEASQAANVINVRSDAFPPNQPIPDVNSAYGQDLSPALSWSGVPAGAKSVVLMMEDPDASGPKPFVHWLVANLPANVTSLPASLPKTENLSQSAGAAQGANHTGQLGYYGPHPPSGEPPHHYHFQVFALDTVPQLPHGFNRHALIEAMRGHVLAKGELTGTYQRKP